MLNTYSSRGPAMAAKQTPECIPVYVICFMCIICRAVKPDLKQFWMGGAGAKNFFDGGSRA